MDTNQNTAPTAEDWQALFDRMHAALDGRQATYRRINKMLDDALATARAKNEAAA